jgi:hypothetical protein
MKTQKKIELIECAGEGASIVVFNATKWERLRAWLSKQVIADYPYNETSTMGRG